MSRFLATALAVLALAAVFGWAGERDRADARAYGAVRAQIYASAGRWAVDR